MQRRFLIRIARVESLAEVIAELRRLHTSLETHFDAPMREALDVMRRAIPPYPPPPPNSTYVRTGLLGNSFEFDVHFARRTVVGAIANTAPYAPYVIDAERQAWMHRGRWWTLQRVLRGVRARVVEIFRDFLSWQRR